MKKIIYLTIGTIGLCFILLFLSHILLQNNSSNQFLQGIKQHQLILTFWRFSLYILAILFWPVFIKIIGKRQHWPDKLVYQLSHQRTKLLIFFVIIEIFFIYNLIGYLLGLF